MIQADRHYPFDRFNGSQIIYDDSDHLWPGEVLPIEVSRGCIFKCGFCEFPGVGKRRGSFQKEPSVLREELIDNYERFGVTQYMFMDNLINDDIEKIKVLHGVITSLPFRLRWLSFARLDLYTRFPDMIPLLKEMGCASQFFGVETLSANARKMLGKGSSRSGTSRRCAGSRTSSARS